MLYIGTFPVGEVFTETKSLEHVNGILSMYAFPNTSRYLEICTERVLLHIEKSEIVKVTDAHGNEHSAAIPSEFNKIIDMVRTAEQGIVRIREFGLGLNDAMNIQNPVNDITAFERQIGLHVSLGSKHTGKQGTEIMQTSFLNGNSFCSYMLLLLCILSC